jgi:hypothetical protein
MIGTERGRIILLSMIFVPKVVLQDILKFPGIPFQLERRSKLVFLFPYELI